VVLHGRRPDDWSSVVFGQSSFHHLIIHILTLTQTSSTTHQSRCLWALVIEPSAVMLIVLFTWGLVGVLLPPRAVNRRNSPPLWQLIESTLLRLILEVRTGGSTMCPAVIRLPVFQDVGTMRSSACQSSMLASTPLKSASQESSMTSMCQQLILSNVSRRFRPTALLCCFLLQMC
jgi:hypothetical protein